MTEDFVRLLGEHGLTEVPDALRQAYEDSADQIEFPCRVSVDIRPSNIQGLGVFATASFKANELLAPMRIGSRRTPAGRYTNHSDSPNAAVIWTDHAAFLKASRTIAVNEEVTIDYRTVLSRGAR